MNSCSYIGEQSQTMYNKGASITPDISNEHENKEGGGWKNFLVACSNGDCLGFGEGKEYTRDGFFQDFAFLICCYHSEFNKVENSTATMEENKTTILLQSEPLQLKKNIKEGRDSEKQIYTTQDNIKTSKSRDDSTARSTSSLSSIKKRLSIGIKPSPGNTKQKTKQDHSFKQDKQRKGWKIFGRKNENNNMILNRKARSHSVKQEDMKIVQGLRCEF